MAIHHGTYLDIPPDKRQIAAGGMERNIREQLADPDLSGGHRAKLLARAERLSKWIAGTIEVADVQAVRPDGTPKSEPVDDEPKKDEPKKDEPKGKGVDHEVEVTEEVVVIEGD